MIILKYEPFNSEIALPDIMIEDFVKDKIKQYVADKNKSLVIPFSQRDIINSFGMQLHDNKFGINHTEIVIEVDWLEEMITFNNEYVLKSHWWAIEDGTKLRWKSEKLKLNK